jgi:hypothetical protein
MSTSPERSITSAMIVEALRGVVEDDAEALALMEGGSAAFGRLDEWSDVDLYLIVEDGSAERFLQVVEDGLAERFGIEARHVEAQPTWHGHHQRVYQLRGASPYLLVDLCVMQRSNLARERSSIRHGRPVVFFDKADVTHFSEPDPEAFREKLRARVEAIASSFHMFQTLVTKNVARGNAGEAVAYFNAYTLRPLTELLRIRHDPYRHDYGVRYARDDLPIGVAARLSDLFLVRDLDELVDKHADAVRWFDETLDGLDVDTLAL